MEIYLQIEKVYFKHHFCIHVMIAFLLCFLSPFVIGVENLDKYQTAKVLEMFFSLMGIILLIPVFLPDFDLSIRELLESKKVPLWLLRVLRLLQSIFILLILLFIYLLFLKQNQCEFPFWSYFLGTIADCFFLGGMGLVIYSITDYVTIAYLVPFFYFIANISGGKYLWKFYLFSMMEGSFEENWYLLTLAGIFFFIAMGYNVWRKSDIFMQIK